MRDDGHVSAGRDADPCERPGRRPQVPPRHAAVWIHVLGAWRRGAVHGWFRLDDGRRAVWLQYEDPGGSPWTCWGAFVYDPETVRPRDGES